MGIDNKIFATSNPYRIEGPLCISFSGGRSSRYMLTKIIEAWGGSLPDDIVVCFANTGKEMPETLDFVRDCQINLDIDIVWIELSKIEIVGHKSNGDRIFDMDYKIVDYDSASRDGEPFKMLTDVKGIPNPVARFCTADLKTRRINQYLREGLGWDSGYYSAIGIRGDESSRAHKILNGKSDSGEDKIIPMWHEGVTKHDVAEFSRAQSFDLNLPNNNGTTDWGNCDLCFLKGADKKLSIARERPDLVEWWEEVERKNGTPFRLDHPSYSKMREINKDQFVLGFDDSVPCFCGD